jgi:hypothetical protein
MAIRACGLAGGSATKGMKKISYKGYPDHDPGIREKEFRAAVPF